MLVWQKIAEHTRVTKKEQIEEWLKKYDITACVLENEIKYTGIDVICIKDCDVCKSQYLDIELNGEVFNEVVDEFGSSQLMFGEEFYRKGKLNEEVSSY